MSAAPGRTPSEESALRFHLAVQRSRFGVLLLMGAVAAFARTLGLIHFSIAGAAAAAACSYASYPILVALHRRARTPEEHLRIHTAWMLFDVAMTCVTVWLIGDSSPLWLIWFLTNVTAAAFVAGRRQALLGIVASCAAYLTTLVLMGRIRGVDAELGLACGRLALLFGGTWFMVRGIADLRSKRLEIAALHSENSARVEELSRLTSELDRRSTELAEANRRIQEANRAKSQFLANMSHELRTPLNSIIGFSEILGEKLDGRIEPRFTRFLHNILSSGRHLLGLINDILDLSKIEAGKMELIFEPVSIANVMHGVESVMQGVASRRRIRIVVDVAPNLPPIVADPPRIKQVLYNLLSNAVKFSPEGSTVELRARLAERRPPGGAGGATTMLLEVVDQGLGIRSEDQQLIFEEFRQVDGGMTRNMGGTGLGLALVKRFVEMHGGEIEVESELGKGSVFRVCLPLDAESAMSRRMSDDPISFGFPVTEVRAAVEPGAEGAPLVLVAEDDEIFSRALAVDLEAAGYRVLRARDGDEALALAAGERPAAITLDLVLPGRDGWEVLKQLKSDPATAGVPVIIVSLVENHELGFALGADDYFLKPLDRERFLRRVQELTPPPAGGARAAVLLIDDDPQVHEILELELTEAGYELHSAGNARAGLEIAARRRPAVIILDLVMDGMDGFQAAHALRRDPATEATPILVFTSKELTAEDRARLAGSANALFSKAPDDRKALVRTIRELRARRGISRTLGGERDRTAHLGD